MYFTNAVLYLRYSKIPGVNEGVLSKGPTLTSPGKLPRKVSPDFMTVSEFLWPNTLLLFLKPGSAGHRTGSLSGTLETTTQKKM